MILESRIPQEPVSGTGTWVTVSTSGQPVWPRSVTHVYLYPGRIPAALETRVAIRTLRPLIPSHLLIPLTPEQHLPPIEVPSTARQAASFQWKRKDQYWSPFSSIYFEPGRRIRHTGFLSRFKTASALSPHACFVPKTPCIHCRALACRSP